MVAENQPGHIDQIKQTNAGAVYRLIDQLGPVSRIDLSRLAQLAPASITKIVREMLLHQVCFEHLTDNFSDTGRSQL
ncbi:hypothetical protein LDY78_19490, partial [Escherichia coli]|nr:hypothetical protein [Escherichia coli]